MAKYLGHFKINSSLKIKDEDTNEMHNLGHLKLPYEIFLSLQAAYDLLLDNK